MLLAEGENQDTLAHGTLEVEYGVQLDTSVSAQDEALLMKGSDLEEGVFPRRKDHFLVFLNLVDFSVELLPKVSPCCSLPCSSAFVVEEGCANE